MGLSPFRPRERGAGGRGLFGTGAIMGASRRVQRSSSPRRRRCAARRADRPRYSTLERSCSRSRQGSRCVLRRRFRSPRAPTDGRRAPAGAGSRHSSPARRRAGMPPSQAGKAVRDDDQSHGVAIQAMPPGASTRHLEHQLPRRSHAVDQVHRQERRRKLASANGSLSPSAAQKSTSPVGQFATAGQAAGQRDLGPPVTRPTLAARVGGVGRARRARRAAGGRDGGRCRGPASPPRSASSSGRRGRGRSRGRGRATRRRRRFRKPGRSRRERLRAASPPGSAGTARSPQWLSA